MAVERDQFFAELEALTDSEIEARLPLWDHERLALVEEYVSLRESAKTAAHSATRTTTEAVLVAVGLARRATMKANVALILALGAWLAAAVAGVMAYLAFRP
ncbi:MAG: hypothetical protein ACREDO_06295 [Methyloceanibacter sp.]